MAELSPVQRAVLRALVDTAVPSLPAPDGEDREVVLHRCPLLQAAHRFPDVVCSVHLGMVQSALEANGASSEGSELRPFSAPGQCYLRLGA